MWAKQNTSASQRNSLRSTILWPLIHVLLGGKYLFVCLFVCLFWLFPSLKDEALEIFFFLFHDPQGVGTSKQRETSHSQTFQLFLHPVPRIRQIRS